MNSFGIFCGPLDADLPARIFVVACLVRTSLQGAGVLDSATRQHIG